MKFLEHDFHKRISFCDYFPYRDDYIMQKCKGKKVLHLGATDWPYTKEKLDKDSLLFAKLDGIVKDQLGVDMDKEGMDFLNGKGFKNSRIIFANLDNLQNLDYKPDIVLFGETMEHLMNLENALGNIKKVMRADTELVLSVPNATNLPAFLFALFGHEHQHPDHKVAFTYKTITQLLVANGFELNDIKMTWLIRYKEDLGWKGKLAYAIIFPVTRAFPLFAGNILVVAKKRI